MGPDQMPVQEDLQDDLDFLDSLPDIPDEVAPFPYGRSGRITPWPERQE
jgi:hypothetical protein